MKTANELIATLHMVQARLDSTPTSSAEWDVIRDALRDAHSFALRQADALATTTVLTTATVRNTEDVIAPPAAMVKHGVTRDARCANGGGYAGDYRSGIARAKRILLAAGFAWSKTTGRYEPFRSTKVTTKGVKVTRLGCSSTIVLHVHDGRDGYSYNNEAVRAERRDMERRAIDALRAGGLPFDDRGWLDCNVRVNQ